MGMYDTITGVSVKCPKCKEVLSEFQSKDGECLLLRMNFKEVWNFYTNCPCGAWIEFTLKEHSAPIESYEMTVNKEIVETPEFVPAVADSPTSNKE